MFDIDVDAGADGSAPVLIDGGLTSGERCALLVEVDMEPARDELTDDDGVRSGRDCDCCGEVEWAMITRNLPLLLLLLLQAGKASYEIDVMPWNSGSDKR